MEVDFIPEKHIERAACDLLFAYGRKYGEVAAPPVPVEEMLECHLGLTMGFDDLPKRFGEPGILGATWIEDKNVLIDQSLDPAENPRLEGRYRFTVAHEAGHWVLHRHQLIQARSAPLIDSISQPSIICRAGGKKKPIESQADRFAGYLLMPEEMVLRHWTEMAGALEPYVAKDEILDLIATLGLAEDEKPTVEIAKRMAGVFHVSGQAMQIRLIKLGLILTEKPPPSLFG